MVGVRAAVAGWGWREPRGGTGRRSAFEQCHLERFGLGRRAHAQLLDQPSPDGLVDPERLGTVAPRRVQAHQLAVTGLPEWLQPNQLLGVANSKGELAEGFEAGDHALESARQLGTYVLRARLRPGAVA